MTSPGCLTGCTLLSLLTWKPLPLHQLCLPSFSGLQRSAAGTRVLWFSASSGSPALKPPTPASAVQLRKEHRRECSDVWGVCLPCECAVSWPSDFPLPSQWTLHTWQSCPTFFEHEDVHTACMSCMLSCPFLALWLPPFMLTCFCTCFNSVKPCSLMP